MKTRIYATPAVKGLINYIYLLYITIYLKFAFSSCLEHVRRFYIVIL